MKGKQAKTIISFLVGIGLVLLGIFVFRWVTSPQKEYRSKPSPDVESNEQHADHIDKQEESEVVVASGLEATFYKGLVWELPSAEKQEAEPKNAYVLFSDVYPDINNDWHPSPAPAPFSAKWEGMIEIESAGKYRFAIESDDGSALYLDGRLVVNNWGKHAPRLKRGFRQLEAGLHSLLILYYNENFGARMRFLWTPPGKQEEVVPATVLKRSSK